MRASRGGWRSESVGDCGRSNLSLFLIDKTRHDQAKVERICASSEALRTRSDADADADPESLFPCSEAESLLFFSQDQHQHLLDCTLFCSLAHADSESESGFRLRLRPRLAPHEQEMSLSLTPSPRHTTQNQHR